MVPLGSRDLRRLLDYGHTFDAPGIWQAGDAIDRVLEAVSDLVPGDIAVIAVAPESQPLTAYATEDALAVRRNAAHDLWKRCLDEREHPVVSYHGDTGDPSPVKLSDFVTRLTLRRTTLFDYFWRPFGIDRALGARIVTPVGCVDLGTYRSGLDYSERDRSMLDGLTTHAGRLLRRSEVAELASLCKARFALTAREAEIVAWAIRGETIPAIASLLVLSTATVKAHLRNVYRETGWGSRALAAAAVYTAREANERPTAIDGARLGLTARETDAITAAARGWTNRQIASGLGVSLETAKTHLRNAYQKLGVGSRAGAVARLLEPGALPAESGPPVFSTARNRDREQGHGQRVTS